MTKMLALGHSAPLVPNAKLPEVIMSYRNRLAGERGASV